MKACSNILIAFLILISIPGFTQTVPLPDTNLVAKLQADYPGLMQGDELIIAEANAFAGRLNLNDAGISNTAGIEHFTSIHTLEISRNDITEIPQLSTLTQLENIYLGYNKLQSLPDLTSLVNLVDLQFPNNQVASIPNLPVSIRDLYINDNNIIRFPFLGSLNNLRILVMGNNPIAEPIDFGVVPGLTQLHIHQTGADTILGLDKLTNLTTLYAWGNNIRDLSALDANTSLRIFTVFDNPLAVLPDLTNKPDLNTVIIVNSYLTFEDLEFVNTLSVNTLQYIPQRILPFPDQVARAGDELTLSYPVENPLSTNMYVWKKDGIVVDSSSSSTLDFASVVAKDSGTFSLTVYNSTINENLVLEYEPFQVNVLPCMDVDVNQVNIISSDCKTGYRLNMANVITAGGTAPYDYKLVNESFNELFQQDRLENIPAGKYTVTITNAKGCTKETNLNLDKIKGCEAVFSPDGDGFVDTYFIDSPGTIEIYDVRRQLVTSLTGPVAWDGTDDSGAVVDAGYYIILATDQEPRYITVVR